MTTFKITGHATSDRMHKLIQMYLDKPERALPFSSKREKREFKKQLKPIIAEIDEIIAERVSEQFDEAETESGEQ